MASAGQAHAHSSQPMHFSSPSGHRLSWWRPWNRGAVGTLTSGYCTVSTLVNSWWKATPKPLTGLRKSVKPTGDLLWRDAMVVGCVERRHGEAAGGRLVWGGGRASEFGDQFLDLVPRGDPVPHERHQQQRDHRRAAVHQDVVAAVTLVGPGLHEGDQKDPAELDGHEDLPAQLHQLVVADPGQRAAQPDEEEDEGPHL